MSRKNWNIGVGSIPTRASNLNCLCSKDLGGSRSTKDTSLVTPWALRVILANLPKFGSLFPYLRTVRPKDRANEFRQRCTGLKIQGVTLHSYRYAWAERAKVVGYPERFAQLALGQNSKAVHRAYSKNALVTLPPMQDYERRPLITESVSLSFAALG